MSHCFRVMNVRKHHSKWNTRVIYDCDKYADTPSVIASKRMMDAAGVRYYQYHRTGREIKIVL